MSRSKPLNVFKHVLNVTSAFLITLSSMGTALLVPQLAAATSNDTHVVCDKSCNADSLQAVINAASAGDTLDFAGDVTLSHSLNITKPLTIEGNTKKLSSLFAKTDDSNNAVLSPSLQYT